MNYSCLNDLRSQCRVSVSVSFLLFSFFQTGDFRFPALSAFERFRTCITQCRQPMHVMFVQSPIQMVRLIASKDIIIIERERNEKDINANVHWRTRCVCVKKRSTYPIRTNFPPEIALSSKEFFLSPGLVFFFLGWERIKSLFFPRNSRTTWVISLHTHQRKNDREERRSLINFSVEVPAKTRIRER